MSNGTRPLAFIDVETTGTRPGVHELLEVGAVVVNGEAPYAMVDSFAIKIKPARLQDAQPDALAVNRYSDDEWRDALPSEPAVKAFCEKVKGASLWGWNVGFDRAFLEPAMNRAGIGLETCGIDYTWYDLKMEFIRWAKLTGRESEFTPRFSLRAAYQAFRIENDDAHRALSDALTTYRIFLRLQEEFSQFASQRATQRLPF